MARLNRKPSKLRVSKSEAKGNAAVKLRFSGSLNLPDAADYLGIHKYTLRDQIHAGNIQGYYIGNRYYVGEEELLRLRELLGKYGSLAKAFKQERS